MLQPLTFGRGLKIENRRGQLAIRSQSAGRAQQAPTEKIFSGLRVELLPVLDDPQRLLDLSGEIRRPS